jgi:hypothetical protein
MRFVVLVKALLLTLSPSNSPKPKAHACADAIFWSARAGRLESLAFNFRKPRRINLSNDCVVCSRHNLVRSYPCRRCYCFFSLTFGTASAQMRDVYYQGDLGSKVSFEGVPNEFTKEPFLVNFNVENVHFRTEEPRKSEQPARKKSFQ